MRFSTLLQSAARQQARSFARGRRSKRRPQRGDTLAGVAASSADAPLLSATLRKLFFKVHPDRMHAFPEVAERNADAMSQLTGFLDDITADDRTASTATNRKMRRLDFFIPAPEAAVDDAATASDAEAVQRFKRVRLSLRDSGGDCRKAIQKQLSPFFAAMGLDADFVYDEKYTFSAGDGAAPRLRKSKRARQEEEAHERGEAPPMSGAEAVEAHNAVLQAIAALPWLEETHKVRAYVEGVGLDELSAQGLQLRSVAQRVWRGERDATALSRGLSETGGLCVERILEHTAMLESTNGAPEHGPNDGARA
jgi:hypothetical protein